MKLYSLRGRKSSERLLEDGNTWKGSTFVVRWLPGQPRNQRINTVKQGMFVGVLASNRLDKSAVNRNRMRRRCREALRRHVKELDNTTPAIQLLLLPRRSSLKCEFTDIEKDVRIFLSSVS